MAAFVAWGRLVYIGSSGLPQHAWALHGCPDEKPDLELVDAIARAALAAKRAGGRLRIEDAAPALVEVLELAGLCREMLGEPECLEERAAVQEGVEPGDPSLG